MSVALALVGAALELAGAGVAGAGRRPYGGTVDVVVPRADAVLDPHLAADPTDRMLAALVHGRLYRPVVQLDGGVELVPELAAGPGGAAEGTLTVSLSEAARCHDGQLLSAADVVASWTRVASVGPLRAMASVVKASEAGPRAVTFSFPRAMSHGDVLGLLARPEAAMLRGGRAATGAGCGAFRPTAPTADGSGRLVLEAFAGHAEGRPWLDKIRVKVDARAALATAFRYGESQIAWEPVPVAPPGALALGGGWTTFYAVPRPGLRGAEALSLRQRVLALAGEARLQRYVEGRGVAASSSWPDPLFPGGTRPTPAAAAPPRSGLVIAYPDGDEELAELARALRDALRPLGSDNTRVVPIPGARLSLGAAVADRDPLWDLAVVRHTWAATRREQAALELAAEVAGAVGGPLSAAEAFTGGARRWADTLSARLELVPLVHVPRGPIVAAGLRGVSAEGAVPALVDAWRAVRSAP